MAVTEQEMLEDLAYTESEGPADMGEDERDRLGEEDEFDAFGEEDDYEAEDYGDPEPPALPGPGTGSGRRGGGPGSWVVRPRRLLERVRPLERHLVRSPGVCR